MVTIIKDNAMGQMFCFECATLFTYEREDIEVSKYPISYNVVGKRYDIHCPCCNQRITLNVERIYVENIDEALK